MFKCIVLSFLLLPFSVFALNIQDAVNMALESDDSIKQNVSLLKSKEYQSRSAYASFLPYANLGYTHTDLRLKNKGSRRFDAENSDLSLQIGMNLFNGLSDWRNLEILNVNYDIQNYTNTTNSQQIILSTKMAYIKYLKARQALAVAEETLELLKNQKRIAEVSYSIGEFSRSDVLRVDVQLANTELQLLNARIEMKLAKQELEKYIGQSIDSFEIIDDINLTTDFNIPDLDSLYSMIETKSVMMSAKNGVIASDLDKKSSLGSFMPTLNVGYSWSWNGDHYNPFSGLNNEFNKKSKTDRSGAFVINASWNLFSGFNSYNTYLSKSAVSEAAAYAVSDTRKKIRLQAASIYENYFSAQERLTVAEVAVSQAKESYRVTQNQYANGSATTTDLLDASVALNNALTSEYSAKYDVVIAIANIESLIETNLMDLGNL